MSTPYSHSEKSVKGVSEVSSKRSLVPACSTRALLSALAVLLRAVLFDMEIHNWPGDNRKYGSNASHFVRRQTDVTGRVFTSKAPLVEFLRDSATGYFDFSTHLDGQSSPKGVLACNATC
jgi:hypothetical protein